MSNSNKLLEQYRAAREKFNTISNQQETLYHKRQRAILENIRSDAYKHTLMQTKRREWSLYRRRTNEQPVRLSTKIRDSFQLTKEKQPSSSKIAVPIANSSSRSIVRTYPPAFNIRSVISEQSMNLEILQKTLFLGQFDGKFLITKHDSNSSSNSKRTQLILFDQHAISERILLERLQTYFKQQTFRSISFRLSEPIAIARDPRFLYTYEQISILERTGFSFSSISTYRLLVRAVPNWLLSLGQRQSSSAAPSHDIIYTTINNILLKTNHASANTDLIMYETLKSLACHNAIKFNDILTRDECESLLNELKHCAMPFICAHGRTSTAILWEYEIVSENYQVNMIELEQLASIHKWLKTS